MYIVIIFLVIELKTAVRNTFFLIAVDELLTKLICFWFYSPFKSEKFYVNIFTSDQKKNHINYVISWS